MCLSLFFCLTRARIIIMCRCKKSSPTDHRFDNIVYAIVVGVSVKRVKSMETNSNVTVYRKRNHAIFIKTGQITYSYFVFINFEAFQHTPCVITRIYEFVLRLSQSVNNKIAKNTWVNNARYNNENEKKTLNFCSPIKPDGMMFFYSYVEKNKPESMSSFTGTIDVFHKILY
jgi:hypothetical protein